MKLEERKKRNFEIFKMRKKGNSYEVIAKKFNMAKSAIHKIVTKIVDSEEMENLALQEQEFEINSRLLKDIAMYLEGIKAGKGDLLPLGTVHLEELWKSYRYFVKLKR